MKWLPGPEVLFVVGALVVVPVLLSRYLAGGTWLQVGCGFLGWYLLLWLALGGPGISGSEGAGWTMIMGLFFSWAGMPIITLVMRLAKIPYRFF